MQSLLLRSLALSGAVALLSALAGGVYGFAVAAGQLPSRQGYALAGLLPLALPPTVAAVAWLDISGHLARLGVVPAGWPAVVAAQVLAFFPLVALAVWVGARQLDPRLEDAARLCLPPSRVLTRVTLPLLAPYWGLGALLVLLFSFNDTALPSLLQVHVFAVEVNTSLGTFLSSGQAAALSAPPALMMLALAALLGGPPRGLGRWLPPDRRYLLPWAPALMSLLAALAAGLPCLWLLLSAGSWSLALEQGGGDLLRTGLQSVVVAVLSVALGYALALSTRARWPLWLALLGLFLPPALLVEGWHRFLPDGPALALAVFLGRSLAFPLGIAMARRAQLDRGEEEAARLSGRPGLLLGLYGRSAWASGLVVYVLCTADLSAHLLADPPGWGSLPVRIFSLAHYGRMDLVAVLCLAEVALLALPLLWLRRAR